MALTLEQQILLGLIVGAAVLEFFFVVRAITEVRVARAYDELVRDLLQRPPGR